MDNVELPSWMDANDRDFVEVRPLPDAGRMGRDIVSGDHDHMREPFARVVSLDRLHSDTVAQYATIATDLIARIHAVPAIDREHVKGVRLIRDRLNAHLAELADFDRSGVTG